MAQTGFTTNVKTSMSFVYKNNPRGSHYGSIVDSKSNQNQAKFKKNK